MEIVLNILRADILNSKYTNANECAITKALARAGYPEYRDCGSDITLINNSRGVLVTDSNKTYNSLTKKVIRRYKHKENGLLKKVTSFKHKIII